MPYVVSDGLKIHYELAGAGPPLVLLQGYTGSAEGNWRIPGWVDRLRGSHRLVLIDHRGHGRSDKPHDPARYSVSLMAADVVAVLDALGIESAAVMGYSMGSMVTMELLLNYAERFTAAVIGGMGSSFPQGRREWRQDCRDEETAPAPPLPRRPGTILRTIGTFVRHWDPLAQRAV